MTQGLPNLGALESRRGQMFPTLTQAQLERITPFGVQKLFDPDAIIFEQCDRNVPFYVLIEGQIEVVHPHGKLEDPITVHRPMEFTGEVSLLTDRGSLVRGSARGHGVTLRT